MKIAQYHTDLKGVSSVTLELYDRITNIFSDSFCLHKQIFV